MPEEKKLNRSDWKKMAKESKEKGTNLISNKDIKKYRSAKSDTTSKPMRVTVSKLKRTVKTETKPKSDSTSTPNRRLMMEKTTVAKPDTANPKPRLAMKVTRTVKTVSKPKRMSEAYDESIQDSYERTKAKGKAKKSNSDSMRRAAMGGASGGMLKKIDRK